MQQQALKLRIVFVILQSIKSETFENGPVILAFEGISDNRLRIHCVSGACLVIEDRGIEFFLRCEVAKHHSFRDTRGVGDLFRSRSAKALPGKQTYSDAQDLTSPLLTRHSGSTVRSRRVSQCF